MNISKSGVSLIVASTLFGTHLFAADTLEEAFKNGKVSGEIRAYYFDRDNGVSHENILATGVMLNYVTESYNGLKAGFTFQSSQTPFADEGGKQMFKNDMWAQGAQLSESYLAYTLGKTEAKVGRMYLSTPLIAGSGSRLIREAFEGGSIVNTDLTNTTLGAVYIDKFQARTNRAGDIGHFDQYRDGAYSLYAFNKSISGLTLIGAWAQIKEYTTTADLDIYYAEALYDAKIAHFGYNFSGQYWANKYSTGAVDSIDGFALKAGGSYADVSGYVAYSKISNDPVAAGKLLHGVGNGSDTIYTNSLIGSYNYSPNMEAYAFNLEYALTPAAKLGTLYTYTDTDTDVARASKNEKVSYTGIYGSYSFSGTLKGLSIIAQYENLGEDVDGDQFRLKGSYKF